MSEHRNSWVDNVPSRTAFGLGAAIGVGAIGIVGFFFLLPSAMRGEEQPATNQPPVVVVPDEGTPTAPQPVDIAVSADDHVRGNPDASITIVEWSDFQCPFCSRFHPTVQQVIAEYGDDVRWVYRHFPLDSLHSEARPAAEASECADEQGKFWEFADALYEHQDELSAEYYDTLADELGLDRVQFDECVASRKYESKVRAQEQSGLAVGVRGTPGSYINGIEIPGAVPFAQLQSVIESILAE
ncbi:MAG: DsbA family protein [Candidatus Uhrbacteria bacterium]